MDTLGFHRNDVVLILQDSFDHQESATGEQYPVPFINIRRHNRVGDAGFIFQAKEEKSFGRPWSLSGDDATGNACEPPVRDCLQIARPLDVHSIPFSPVVSHGMTSNGEPGTMKVGNQAFFIGHL